MKQTCALAREAQEGRAVMFGGPFHGGGGLDGVLCGAKLAIGHAGGNADGLHIGIGTGDVGLSGEMTWLGKTYAPASPRAALGEEVGMIHQELKLLPKLSIAENVFVDRYPMKSGRIDRKGMEERAQSSLIRLGLDVPPDRLVEGLSTGKQQLIEIAKALTLNVRLLILDEPTAALGGEETSPTVSSSCATAPRRRNSTAATYRSALSSRQ